MNKPSWWNPARAGIFAGMGFLAIATVIVILVVTMAYGIGRVDGAEDCPEAKRRKCDTVAYHEESLCVQTNGQHLEACAERLKLRLERCDQIFDKGGTP